MPDHPKAKRVPEGATQHATAGPYSPVLVVGDGELVVLSGQAAIDHDGRTVGETVEAQTAFMLENCRRQLASAGCTLADVFKVTLYLADVSDSPRVNDIYAEMMPRPWPARTAVGVALLEGLLVEADMWAVRPPRQPASADAAGTVPLM